MGTSIRVCSLPLFFSTESVRSCGFILTERSRLNDPSIPTVHRTKVLPSLRYGFNHPAVPLPRILGRSIDASRALFPEVRILFTDWV